MESVFLKSLVLILGISALVVFILGRLKIPSIVGFLIAGMFLGPNGFEFIKNTHDVEVFAEIGVVLLMFTIGLEFSFKNLMLLRSVVFGGGSLQVTLTTAAVGLLSYLFFNRGMSEAVFNGFLVSLSSTAIVLKILFDRAEVHTSYGRSSIGILIFQDLCVVPLMFLIPVLSGKGGEASEITWTVLKAALLVTAMLLAARWAVPHILHQVVRLRMRELFVITIILLCLGTALLTARFGLSLALGAFLAGMIISESEYASQVMADTLPFKESFMGLFFISIGMLLDLGFLRMRIASVIGVVLIMLVTKILMVLISTLATGQSVRTAIQTSFYLCQVGEFSFVLAVAGKTYGLITEGSYQIFLSASVLTMMITPFIIDASFPVSKWLASTSLLEKLDRGRVMGEEGRYPDQIGNHVIIVGFGLNGSNLAKVLKESGIPHVILEFNSDIVRKMKKGGQPIYYGDGTSLDILRKLRIKAAKVLVIAISDASATRRITQLARKENPDLYIIVRTRYLAEVDDLIKLGANEVIPEEFETSVEIFSRVLHHYHVPMNLITENIENIRRNCYRVLRSVGLPKKLLTERFELLQGIETETYLLKQDSAADGHTLKELNLRTQTGATIMAIQRNDKVYQNPAPDFALKTGDIVLLIGKMKELHRAVEYLESERFDKG